MLLLVMAAGLVPRLCCTRRVHVICRWVEQQCSYVHEQLGANTCVVGSLACLLCLHHQVKRFLRRKDATDPGLVDEQAAVSRFLERLFLALAARSPAVTSHAAVVAAGARCIQSYASLVAKQDSLVDGVVQYLFGAMGVPDAAEFAATAMHGIW